jgi:hypothetical protein
MAEAGGVLTGLVAERCGDRALSLVRMLIASINFEFGKHVPGQGVFLWQHSLDGLLDQIGGLAFQPLTVTFHLLTVVAVVPGVVAVFEFSSAHDDLFGVDYDHELTRVDVGRVLGTMLAHQNHCDFGGQPPQGAIRGIHNVPFLIDLADLCDRRFLLSNHSKS